MPPSRSAHPDHDNSQDDASKELVIEGAEVVAQALRKFRASRADFADCLIERCGHAVECKHTVTFDQNAAAGTGMLLR
jgi:predicted nucleic-acid-binding protein